MPAHYISRACIRQQEDVKAEEEAITLYKDIIRQAASEGDETTRLLFEEILSREEDHHDTFTTLLGR
jgi:bacterioferritin